MSPDWDHKEWLQRHEEKKNAKQAKDKIPKDPPAPPESEKGGGGGEPRDYDTVLGF